MHKHFPLPDNVIDSCPDGGWGWIVVFASFVCMILVEGVCLSYGLLVAPICPGNSLRAVAPSIRSASRSASGYATATSLGIVWSTNARTIPIKPGSCVGVSEMGESLNTQSRMALMAPGGMLIGLYILLGGHCTSITCHYQSHLSCFGAILCFQSCLSWWTHFSNAFFHPHISPLLSGRG